MVTTDLLEIHMQKMRKEMESLQEQNKRMILIMKMWKIGGVIPPEAEELLKEVE